MINRPTRTRTSAATGGFTLVELLVVMALIGIIVTMVISVGSSVRIKAAEDETHARLGLLRGALETYYELMGDYPVKVGAYVSEPKISVGEVINVRGNSDHKNYWTADPPRSQRDSAKRNMAFLMSYLLGLDETRKAVGLMPAECYVDEKTWPDGLYPLEVYGNDDQNDPPAKEYTYILDSFDTPINYQRSGGVGGSPVLISAGVNGIFGDADDLRSDDQ